MGRVILFNKPWGTLSQFTDSEARSTLADFIPLKGFYPAGRLDRDSEGLLVLTDSGSLQHRLTDPRCKTWKRYRVQVEGIPDEAALDALRSGVKLKDGVTAPAKVSRIEIEEPWPRDPPIRYRKKIPSCWLELCIREGRNRQVRRMTAAAGYPTLRLIRHAVGQWSVEPLLPGEWQIVETGMEQTPARGSTPAGRGRSRVGPSGPGRRERPGTGTTRGGRR